MPNCNTSIKYCNGTTADGNPNKVGLFKKLNHRADKHFK